MMPPELRRAGLAGPAQTVQINRNLLNSYFYHAAERILSSILQQHLGPDVWTTNPWTEIDYEIYRSRYPGKDEHLLLIYDWIHNKDISAIQSYLSDNFVVNSSSNKLT